MSDLIDKYFEKKLTEQEVHALLKENPELQAEFDFQQKVKAAFHLKERAKTKALLQSFEPEKKSKSWRKVAAMAAMVLVALTVGIFEWKSKNVDIIQSFYQPMPNMVQPIERNEKNTALLAFELYENQQYKEALEHFKHLEQTPEVKLYTAVALMAIQEYSKSENILKTVHFQEDKRGLEYYRKWYLSLCFLKHKNEKEAKNILLDLASLRNPVQKQAQLLLDTLD